MLVMDVKKAMVVYYHPGCRQHDIDGHLEGTGRLDEALAALQAGGAWSMADLGGQCPASEQDIERVHTPAYRRRVRDLCRQGVGMLGNSTPACRRSYEAALLAAGGALAAVDAVLTGAYLRSLALVRPPGHHALPDMAMGFCIFNNPALAVKRAQDVYGVERVLVLDWDAHHGNGVERVFYADPGVLYISIHRDFAYPATGRVEKAGEGPGLGYNVNIPLPLRSGDEDYLLAWDQVVAPLADAYRPQLVVVCAGFDAHAADPIGGMNLTDRGFNRLHQAVLELATTHAGGRIVATLEGGYSPEVLGRNLLSLVRCWCGYPDRVRETGDQPGRHTWSALEEVKRVHRATWPCLS